MSNLMNTNAKRASLAVFGAAALAIAVSGSAMAAPVAKAKPNKGLTDGKVVTVTGSGFVAKETVLVLQCNAAVPKGDKNACNTSNIASTTTTATGKVPATKFTVHTGTIGDGTCGTSKADSQCYLAVTNTAGTEVSLVSIKFVP